MLVKSSRVELSMHRRPLYVVHAGTVFNSDSPFVRSS